MPVSFHRVAGILHALKPHPLLGKGLFEGGDEAGGVRRCSPMN